MENLFIFKHSLHNLISEHLEPGLYPVFNKTIKKIKKVIPKNAKVLVIHPESLPYIRETAEIFARELGADATFTHPEYIGWYTGQYADSMSEILAEKNEAYGPDVILIITDRRGQIDLMRLLAQKNQSYKAGGHRTFEPGSDLFYMGTEKPPKFIKNTWVYNQASA